MNEQLTDSQKILYVGIILFGLLVTVESSSSAWSIYKQFQAMAPVLKKGEMNTINVLVQEQARSSRHETVQDQQANLEQFVQDNHSIGVRYIFQEHPHNQAFYAAGAASVDPQSTINNLKYRTLTTLPNGNILMIMPPHDPPKPPRYVMGMPGVPKGVNGGQMPPVTAIEIEPVETQQMMVSAQLKFIMSLIAGGLFFALSVLLVWLLHKRERTKQHLEKQRALAALGQMSTVVSHELRNPLTAALGQAELLREVLEGDRRQKRAGRVVEDLERIATLTDRLVEFIKSGQITIASQQLRPFIQRIQSTLPSPRVQWDIKHLPELASFDPVTLERAIANIANNALQISEDDKSIDISMSHQNDTWIITIRDQGPGLPDDVNILEPFVSERKGGTGLGLAITKEIIHAHNGVLNATNHPDGGAIFTIKLPI